MVCFDTRHSFLSFRDESIALTPTNGCEYDDDAVLDATILSEKREESGDDVEQPRLPRQPPAPDDDANNTR